MNNKNDPMGPRGLSGMGVGHRKMFNNVVVRKLVSGGYTLKFVDGTLAWYRNIPEAIRAIDAHSPIPARSIADFEIIKKGGGA